MWVVIVIFLTVLIKVACIPATTYVFDISCQYFIYIIPIAKTSLNCIFILENILFLKSVFLFLSRNKFWALFRILSSFWYLYLLSLLFFFCFKKNWFLFWLFQVSICDVLQICTQTVSFSTLLLSTYKISYFKQNIKLQNQQN